MTERARSRVAVLASGGGSNLGALFEDHDARGVARAADVVLVASDRPGAGALARAAARGVPTRTLAAPQDGEALLALFAAQFGIDLVVLAGYLRYVPSAVTQAFAGRVLNVHPSLLPAFGGAGMYGVHVHRAVLAAGVRVSGATVHFVDQAYDRGPIVAQWPVPVRADDTPESLAARVLRVEHVLLPRAVDGVAAGRITLALDGTVRDAGPLAPDAPFTLPLASPDAGLFPNTPGRQLDAASARNSP